MNKGEGGRIHESALFHSLPLDVMACPEDVMAGAFPLSHPSTDVPPLSIRLLAHSHLSCAFVCVPNKMNHHLLSSITNDNKV
jgi:hypothetical protein